MDLVAQTTQLVSRVATTSVVSFPVPTARAAAEVVLFECSNFNFQPFLLTVFTLFRLVFCCLSSFFCFNNVAGVVHFQPELNLAIARRLTLFESVMSAAGCTKHFEGKSTR